MLITLWVRLWKTSDSLWISPLAGVEYLFPQTYPHPSVDNFELPEFVNR